MDDPIIIRGMCFDRSRIEVIQPRAREGDTLVFMQSGKVTTIPYTLTAEEVRQIIERKP